MNWLRTAKISLICTALLGCTSGVEEFEWRPYKDIDGVIKQMRFAEETTAMEYEQPAEKRDLTHFQGYAVSRNEGVEQRIGYLALLRNAEGYMATIFNVQGQSLNPQRPDDLANLAKAKIVDFYEFGQFRLGHARFSGKQAVCQDFKGKNGVDLIMTTNYYPENSFTDFYTSLINVKLHAQSAPKEIGYTPSFTGNNDRLQQEIRTSEQKKGKKIAQDNVLEKASILFNILCK
ncbi:hypothetical protein ACT2CV_04805 [Pasteurellaceae bacterium 22721_9_1]